MSYFEMVSPESLGIRRDGILSFLEACRKSGLEMHRFMLLRGGRCCAKITWAPYTPDDLHPVYSFSKSLTATAIGFARQEGLLSLDEKLADLFPEDIPADPSDNLKACTIHHLLCMSCGHETLSLDLGPNWRRAFFAHPFVHAPGTFYLYNTNGSNILSAVIRKKTGLQITQYLKSRLFEPLGITDYFCYALPDDMRTEHGGGGFKLKLEDMAKFTLFMLQNGWWEGKELLHGWYHEIAGVKQMETAGDSEGHVKDWACGYGYQCWMGSLPGSFRADGAFGQFGLVFPTLDLCVITNAATEQTQTMMDHLAAHLLPAVHAAADPFPVNLPGAAEAIVETRALPVLTGCHNPLFEAVLDASVYRTDDALEMASLKGLVGGAGLKESFDSTPEQPGGLSRIRFAFADDHVNLLLTENGTEKVLTAALDGSFAFSEIDGLRYAATARWRALRRLELEVRRMDAISGVRLILNFSGETLTFEADETLMTDGGLGMTNRHLAVFYADGG